MNGKKHFFKQTYRVIKDGQDLHMAVRCVKTISPVNDQTKSVKEKLNAEYKNKYPGCKLSFVLVADDEIAEEGFEEDNCY